MKSQMNKRISLDALRLDRITMYRLMLYFMILLLTVAAGLSALDILPYNALGIILQSIAFAGICWTANILFARLLKIQPNIESSLITGLILTAIVGPLSLPRDSLVLAVIALAAISSKYLLVAARSHIFNPAAFGVIVSAIALGYPASWWIGSQAMLPAVVLGGLVVMRKIRRFHLIAAFLAVYVGLLALDIVLLQGRSFREAAATVQGLVTLSPLLFFSFVMLVEPLTAPQTTRRRIAFGAVVGVVFFLLQRFAAILPYSFELSLLAGNVFSRIINPDFRAAFILQQQERFSSSISNFWFKPARQFAFSPGQFLEYTLAHSYPDTRGVRRYFTIASSPTEPQVLLTSRFSEPSSTFKQALQKMKEGNEIVASKVAGDFVLPSDAQKKLAFIAGGIGITPFRSIVKYLLDTNQRRDIVLLYGARGEDDLVFRNIFEEVQQKFGMRTVYVLERPIDEATIRREIPDFQERLFYISGPEAMVQAMTKLLASMGIPRRQIKRDYFPGYGAQ